MSDQSRRTFKPTPPPSGEQLLVLRTIALLEEGRATALRITSYSRLSRSVVSNRLHSLNYRGLIESQRRGTMIFWAPTESGWRILREKSNERLEDERDRAARPAGEAGGADHSG